MLTLKLLKTADRSLVVYEEAGRREEGGGRREEGGGRRDEGGGRREEGGGRREEGGGRKIVCHRNNFNKWLIRFSIRRYSPPSNDMHICAGNIHSDQEKRRREQAGGSLCDTGP